MEPAQQHIKTLQSARGIAAVSVVIHHCLFTFNTTGWVKQIAILSWNAATAAVVFFFVLSGFVLTLSLRRRPMTGIVVLQFYTKRFWRIYPALWIACALGLLYAVELHPLATNPHLSTWFTQRFELSKLDAFRVWGSFAALTPFLVPPAWSITVELAGSVIMPAIALSTRKAIPLACMFLAGLFLSFYLPAWGYYNGIYFADFVIGAAIVRVGRYLMPFLRFGQGIPAAGAVVFYMLAFQSALPLQHCVLALSSGILVCTILSKANWRILESAILERIGDISYSIYILHFPIMSIIATVLGLTVKISSNQMALVLALTTLAVTLGVANIVYTYVERAGINTGAICSNALLGRAKA